jgi:hypothetical protein
MEQAEIHTLTSIMEAISEVTINRVWENLSEDNFPQQEEGESIHHMFLLRENLCIILEMGLVEILTSCILLHMQYE